jgi:hypothetical protein
MKSSLLRASPTLLAALIVAGCGGGNGTASIPLSGTAATGAPAANSLVSVSCGKAAAVTTTSAANGSWTVSLSNPTFPCLVTVSGGSLPAGAELHGYATGPTNVDVTPLTSLIGAFATNAAKGAPLTQAMLDAAVKKVNDLLVAAGFAPLPANPLTAKFTPADGDQYDDYLESVMHALAEQNVTLDNLVAQIVASGAPTASLKGPDVEGFDSMPSPLPLSVPSVGFEATQVSSLGEQLSLAAGVPHNLRGVTVGMVSWACQTGDASTDNCVSAAGATFNHPLTLTIRDANGVQIATRTQNFAIPFRPSTDVTCDGPGLPIGRWRAADGSCNTGDLFKAAFDFSSLNVTLPDNFSYDVSFNTQDFGPNPLHAPGPYNSLNVGVHFPPVNPSIGTDPDTSTVRLNGALSNEGYNLLTQVILGPN